MPGIFFLTILASVVKISGMESGLVYLYLDLKVHALVGYCYWLPIITNCKIPLLKIPYTLPDIAKSRGNLTGNVVSVG